MQTLKNQSNRLFAFILFLTISFNLQAATITWVGGTGDWHVASNWDTGDVPAFGDDVLIPSGIATVYSSTATFDRIDIAAGARVNIESPALFIALSDSYAITNAGTIVNDGFMYVIYNNSTSYSTHYGIQNFGTIEQNADLQFSGEFISSIQNESNGRFTNSGVIEISGTTKQGINNYGSFSNSESILMETAASRGILNLSPGSFTNTGSIELNGLNTASSAALGNTGAFTNNSSGYILITDHTATSSTISNFNNGIFTNKGTIELSNTSSSSVIGAHGTLFSNEKNASISISNNTSIGINVNGTFRNRGNIDIDQVTVGVYVNNGFMVNHQKGNLNIFDVSIGMEIYSAGEMRNYGIYNINNTSSWGILNRGQLANRPMGRFTCNEKVNIEPAANFINQGHFISAYNGSGNHPVLGTMTNNGALGDELGKFVNFTNQSVRARPLTGAVQVGVPVADALDVASLSYVTVLSWYTTSGGSTIAGTYNAANNTFTPNSNALGLDKVYARIRINQGGHTRRHPVSIPGGISSFTGGGGSSSMANNENTNDWAGSTFLATDAKVFPNPASDYVIINSVSMLPENAIIKIHNSVGQLVLQHAVQSEVNQLELDLPQKINAGTYFLSAWQAEKQLFIKTLQVQ